MREGNKNGLKHGLSKTPAYRSWCAMLNRCRNQNAVDYPRYGGRGISVCMRWLEFTNFLSDMGERPAGVTLDRVDVDGDYEPSNCRWATGKTQSRNRRNNKLLSMNGRTMCMAAWAEELGVPATMIMNRAHLGWSDNRILTQPPKYLKDRSKP